MSTFTNRAPRPYFSNYSPAIGTSSGRLSAVPIGHSDGLG